MRAVAGLAVVAVPILTSLACGGRYDGYYIPEHGTGSSGQGGDGGATGAAMGGSSGGVSSGGAGASGSGSGSASSGGLGVDVDAGGGSGSSGGASGSSSGVVTTCPSPAMVVPNQACDVATEVSCTSDTTYAGCDGQPAGMLTCACLDGQWFCPEPGITCPADAGTSCPLPAEIQSGMPCDQLDATCPGNPTMCNGQVQYDAFQCVDGVWNDVASASCDADGGTDGGDGG